MSLDKHLEPDWVDDYDDYDDEDDERDPDQERDAAWDRAADEAYDRWVETHTWVGRDD